MDSPRERFVAGVRAQAPPLIGIVPFGLVIGVASIAAGLTPFETLANGAPAPNCCSTLKPKCFV